MATGALSVSTANRVIPHGQLCPLPLIQHEIIWRKYHGRMWRATGTSKLAYACGHMGQMLSPVHVCLVVTNEHFNSNLFHSLRGILAPVAAVIATAVTLHCILLHWR